VDLRRRRIEWSERAFEALDEAIGYVAADSPTAAERLLDRLLAAATSLSDLTERGRVVPEFTDPAIRELIVPPYRILYEHDRQRIRILALVHGRQSFRLRRSDLQKCLEGRSLSPD
jgi:plasmid stabilization system protein ParE